MEESGENPRDAASESGPPYRPPQLTIVNDTYKFVDSDLDRLKRLQALSWLSASELSLLATALAPTDFRRRQVIFSEAALASEANILLKGIARITCQNARTERVTIALIGPGPVPAFPSLSLGQFDFRCEVYHDCRVGSVNWSQFNALTAGSSESPLKKFHHNDLQWWSRLLLRSSGFLELGLHQRVSVALLELASEFGINESRGLLLRVSFSHKEIADLVGASRPRVTEHLGQLEREGLIIRQGRQFIVRSDELANAIRVLPPDGARHQFSSGVLRGRRDPR